MSQPYAMQIDCECHRCRDIKQAEMTWLERMQKQIFVVCEICGNKRCPHATDHSLNCTNSNEPGQAGSWAE